MKNLNRLIVFTTVLIATFSILSDAAAAAQTGKMKKVHFARGKSSAVLKGAAVRGTSDCYIVSAQKNQTMPVKIASLEQTKNFQADDTGEMGEN